MPGGRAVSGGFESRSGDRADRRRRRLAVRCRATTPRKCLAAATRLAEYNAADRRTAVADQPGRRRAASARRLAIRAPIARNRLHEHRVFHRIITAAPASLLAINPQPQNATTTTPGPRSRVRAYTLRRSGSVRLGCLGDRLFVQGMILQILSMTDVLRLQQVHAGRGSGTSVRACSIGVRPIAVLSVAHSSTRHQTSSRGHTSCYRTPCQNDSSRYTQTEVDTEAGRIWPPRLAWRLCRLSLAMCNVV